MTNHLLPIHTEGSINEPSRNINHQSDDSQKSLYKFHTPSTSTTNLRRYLTEIMGFTLMGENTADTGRGITLLTDEEKVELMQLSTLVEKMRQKVLNNQFNDTLKRDRDVITDAIVKPALEIQLDPYYAMDLVGTYADHQCDEKKRQFTLVSLYTPMFTRFRSYSATSDLRETLISHAKVIRAVSLNEELKAALEKVLADLQDRLGFEKMDYEYNDDCKPVRDGFIGLGLALSPLQGY